MAKASEQEKLKSLLHFTMNKDNLKIGITQTELTTMPKALWNKFSCFLLETQGNEAQYSKEQKTLAMCLWYDATVDHCGHAQYFGNNENVKKDELAEALRTIGVPELADNFISAVEYGRADNYVKADKCFKENRETLVKTIINYLCDNSAEFFEIVDEDYTMRQPKWIFWTGAICVAFFFGLMAMFLIIGTEDELLVFSGFGAFGSLGAALAIYAKLWSVTVKKDVITVYIPFRQPREIRLNEISKVRHTLQGYVVYVDGKKSFGVDNVVNDFELFGAQLHAADKMESTQCGNDFAVKRYKPEIAIGLFCVLFFGGLLAWIVFWNDTENLFVYMGFSAFFLATLWWTLYLLHWRITVFGDTLTVKTILRSEKEYDIKEITKADLGKEFLVLYAGEKKIVKVAYNCRGYPILVERLENEGIPFYEKGRLIERIFTRTSQND